MFNSSDLHPRPPLPSLAICKACSVASHVAYRAVPACYHTKLTFRCSLFKMGIEVVPVEDCETPADTDKTSPEFDLLNPPQQCDETMPPYREIKPLYDGHFVNRFPQLDAVCQRFFSLSFYRLHSDAE